jgi:hypothetical protein
MAVVPLQPRGEWFGDARDGDRAMRVSWHLEMGCVVLSTWRSGSCVATTRLTTDEAAHLIGVLADGLAAAAEQPVIDSATTG